MDSFRWQTDTGETGEFSAQATPVITSDNTLIVINPKRITAYSLSDGVIVWQNTNEGSSYSPTIGPDNQIIYRKKDNLIGLDCRAGLSLTAAWPKWGSDSKNSGQAK